MKILYVHGDRVMISGVTNALEKLGLSYEVYPKTQGYFMPKDEDVEELIRYIWDHRITHLISINLMDSLALAAERTGAVYLSIIWDSPYYKLFSEYSRMPNCWYFVFDQKDEARFREKNLFQVCYQPLAVDAVAIQNWDMESGRLLAASIGEKREYENEVCFLGNLYDGNFFDEFCANMPQELQEYFTAFFEKVAFRWDGVNRFSGTISKELLAYIRKNTPGFELINFFEIEDERYFESGYLVHKIAYLERVCILNMLAERYPVTLYTASKTAKDVLHHVKIMPEVSAGREAHHVYQNSKININISLKGIEAGTPLRVLDIMGAGGFAISNYSPETAQLFEEDKEIVMFRTPEELSEKVAFYLAHDKERERIAKAGHEKVMNCYTFEKKIKQMLERVAEGVI